MKLYLILFLNFVWFGTIAKCQAQYIQSQTYTCYQATESINVDGKAEEEPWAAAKWTKSFVDIEGDKKPRPYLDTKVKMLWDDENFYFFAKLEEPHIWAVLNQRDTVIYWDNDFELFFDPDGDTQNYYELELNALNTVWDLMLTKPYRDWGKPINSWDIKGLKTAVYIDGTLNNTADTDAYWSIEVAIPWTSLLETLPKKEQVATGKTMRINFSRVQWETDMINGRYVKRALSENNWVWSPQRAIAMHEPEFWGRVYFAPSTTEVNTNNLFSEETEKVRQILYTIHREQRARLKKLGAFGKIKEELYQGEQQIEWTLDADTYWYHVKLNDPFNNKLIWHIDETGRSWTEQSKEVE